jgi:fatty acid desaturase
MRLSLRPREEDALADDRAAAETPANPYIPPQAFLRDRHDALSYRRSTLVLVGLLYLSLALAATGMISPWWLFLAVPLIYLRLALALHELLHVCPAEEVSWFHRLTMVFESPFCLGYREHRAIHFAHHRFASTDRDPELYQIVGGPWRALANAMISPERGLAGWIRRHGIARSLAIEGALRCAAFITLAALAPMAFLAYWIALRLSVGLASYVFHYALHNSDGVLGTFPLPVSSSLVRAAGVLFGREPVLILTEHERHHLWPRVRARDLLHLPGPRG